MPSAPFALATEFTVGSVLGRTAATVFGNLGVFLPLALLATLPSVLEFLIADSPVAARLCSVIGAILGFIIQGAMAQAVFMVLRGDRPDFGSSLSYAASRGLPLVLTSLLAMLCVLAPLLAGIVSVWALRNIFSLIPCAVCMVLLITIGCVLAVCVPACAVERLGPVDSLRRSQDLTRGYRLRIFCIALVGFLALGLTALLSAVGVGGPGHNRLLVALVLLVIMLPAQAFFSALFAVVYYDLRAVKEGISLDRLAAVFD